ncbi:MAG: hypothetical protein Q8R55_07705 [Candidatus Taylorbacteria bacterium]|nr:hypothetical protein [Candidatus Taylorbacteria bacterium]
MNNATINPIHSDFSVIVSDIQRLPEFFAFAKWYATPRLFRDKETQKEFARAVGVCEDTLSDWKRHPQFPSLVRGFLNEWMKERIPDVIGGLYSKTQSDKCSARDVEMFLRLSGMEISKK